MNDLRGDSGGLRRMQVILSNHRSDILDSTKDMDDDMDFNTPTAEMVKSVFDLFFLITLRDIKQS